VTNLVRESSSASKKRLSIRSYRMRRRSVRRLNVRPKSNDRDRRRPTGRSKRRPSRPDSRRSRGGSRPK